MNFENLKAASEKATEFIFKLIVIFLLQTLVIPLLLLWSFMALQGMHSSSQGKCSMVQTSRKEVSVPNTTI